jgi:hypothetical protein
LAVSNSLGVDPSPPVADKLNPKLDHSFCTYFPGARGFPLASTSKVTVAFTQDGAPGVGEAVGDPVGEEVGEEVGVFVGKPVMAGLVGAEVGADVGAPVGY